MDKSDEFFEANYGEPVDPNIQSILSRLRNVAACFRNAFPETQLVLNQTGNATAWDSYLDGYSDEQSGDSILHTVIILSVFCSVVLLLVVRSSRGGSWTSCKADVAAVAADSYKRESKLSELEKLHLDRVPSWTQERRSFSSTIRVTNETDF